MQFFDQLRVRFPILCDAYVRMVRSKEAARRIARVNRVIARRGKPTHLDDENQFAMLQVREFPRPAPYIYDLLNTWQRGAARIMSLIRSNVPLTDKLSILEVGCGDGITGHCLSDLGHSVILTDLRDWRYEKSRYLPFVAQDACLGLAFDSNSFDLVVSFNAFEHFAAPDKVMREVVRVCKPGGHIRLDFGPLYYSPWGLHAWALSFPYPQFLFSTSFLDKRMSKLVNPDLGQIGSELQPTNRWRIAQFRELWKSSGCQVVSMDEDRDWRYLDLVEEFPNSFCGQELTFDDLTVNSIAITLRKPVVGSMLR